MISFCEAYYEAKGDKEITRPTLIPPKVEEQRDKVQTVCDALITKAEAWRLDAIKALRLQLASLGRVFNSLGAAVLEDIASGCRLAAAAGRADIEAAHTALAADLDRKRELHQKSLKPSLRNPSNKGEKLALQQAEVQRGEASVELAKAKRDKLLTSETQHAQRFLTRMVHLSGLVIALLDATLMIDDLQPANDPPVDVYYALKKKMRIEQREQMEARSTDPMGEGRPLRRHTWAGLPLLELSLAACGLTADQLPRAAPASEEEGVSKPEELAISAELIGNFTRPHRSAIAARDRIYASMRVDFQSNVKEVTQTCEARLATERQWAVNWGKQVSMLEQ